MEGVSSEVSKVIHDDIYTPKENFFLVVGLICALGESRTNVVEYTQEKPHPKIVLPCKDL